MYVEVLICIQTVSAVMKSSTFFYLCRSLQILVHLNLHHFKLKYEAQWQS